MLTVDQACLFLDTGWYDVTWKHIFFRKGNDPHMQRRAALRE